MDVEIAKIVNLYDAEVYHLFKVPLDPPKITQAKKTQNPRLPATAILDLSSSIATFVNGP